MTASIWRNLNSFYNLIGSKCRCSELHFPEAHVCRKCGSTALTEHEFSGKGKIVTYTIIRQQYNDETESEKLMIGNPYIIAIVQLEEGPMITAQISDANPEEVTMGAAVTSVFRKISQDGEDGVIKYGYKFILA
ncbi:Zn-ribbon domain-containing OB-fold protein [Candidatus Woesearchaeota archaeon]|nr:Zn-ribbon domain-containing OB-fold protein [Candidatus Woesearchaeota archaeon]